MCEVPRMREWRPGPITPAMLALLARMQATDSPAVTDWRGRTPKTTLDGDTINGATVNGLHIRGLASTTHDKWVTTYVLTDAGRAMAEQTSGD